MFNDIWLQNYLLHKYLNDREEYSLLLALNRD